MRAGLEVQTFNDDLLMHPEDQDLAARKYPTILHILDHPELRESFQQYDPLANSAKKKGRRWGRTAIILGALAIAGASGEILLLELWQLDWVPALAFFPAVAGIASVLVGNFGVLFGQNKRRWLENRLMTERLRQFHFQTFVCRIPEIIASLQSREAQDQFKAERGIWFEDFRAQVEHKVPAALVSVLEENGDRDVWLHQRRQPLLEFEDHPELRPLFDAYSVLRIEHQLNYVRYKLRPDDAIFSDAAPRQLQLLDWVAGLLIAGLLLLHIAIAIGITVIAVGSFAGVWPGALFRMALHVGGLNVAIIWDMVIIWLAVIALAGRAFEQGLQPGREIERYQQYRSALRAISERFDSAASVAEKIRVMQEMERLSFDEFRNFMITNNNARFVL